MNCSDARNEIVSFLYGELDETNRIALERHIDSCASCRDERDAHRRTLRLLDQWDVPATRATAVASRPPLVESRRRWMRPLLIGVAAGVLAFVALTLLGAQARVERGRVTLSWRLPGAAASTDEREFVDRDELERVLIPIVSALVDVDRRSTEGPMALAQALEERRRDDVLRYERALRSVLRETTVSAASTRRALDDFFVWTASYPPHAANEDSDR